MDFDPADTPSGKMPPFEVTKAIALEQVINTMEKHMGKTCWQLLGQGKAEFARQQLTVAGGGKPTRRAVQKLWTKVKKDKTWFPARRTGEQMDARQPSQNLRSKL